MLAIKLTEDQLYDDKMELIKSMTIKKKLELALKANCLTLDCKDFTKAIISDIKHSFADEHTAIRQLIDLTSVDKTQELEKYLNDVVYSQELL